jgi:mRNA (guanine-N7-)-methyltransferase
MVPERYYNGKVEHRRTLNDGDGVRNTHNFIKACLIQEYVPSRSHLLDLGCGQGGDLLKYKRKHLKSYRGIDVSHRAIERNNARIVAIHLNCRVRLECANFCQKTWEQPSAYDAISCQFAIQYAFDSIETARRVIAQISASLKPERCLIGTVPVHRESPSYTQVVVKLPDDERECIEYSAHREQLKSLCAECGLEEVIFQGFDEFYEAAKKKSPALLHRMRAFIPPDSNNAVFVYRRVPETVVLD